MDRVGQEIRSAGLETRIISSQDGELLRTVTPCGEDGNGSAVADITTVVTPAGTEVAQIYFTLTADLTDAAAAELRKTFPALNFYTMIGSYGIYNGSQVYYKYAVPLSEIDDSELRAGEILDAYAVAYEFLSQSYDIIMALADGRIDHQEIVSRKLIPEL